MKHWLVFYFLINGVWTPGDIAEPDGWTSIQYDSKEICEPKDPKIFWKRSVRQPLLQATILK